MFDIIPLRLLPTTIYTAIVYFMIGRIKTHRLRSYHKRRIFVSGFQEDAGNFFQFYLTLVLLTFTAAGIAFFASCVTRQFLIANLVAVLITILMMVRCDHFEPFEMDTVELWIITYFFVPRFSGVFLSISTRWETGCRGWSISACSDMAST
jgi:ATP-binding cassette subfamily G (WHITE) protein 2